MPRSAPTTLTLPPFAGATRKLVLLNVIAFLLIGIFTWVAPGALRLMLSHLVLVPAAVARGEIWQLATYSLVESSILSLLFGSLTLWFAGSLLESTFSARWTAELYATSVIGGGLLATLLAYTHLLTLRPDLVGSGAWAGIFGLLVAIAMRFGDQEFLLWFVLRLKAKYMVAIYLLLALAVLLKQGDAFSALLELTGAVAGFLYVRFAPRRGLARGLVSGTTEQWSSLRNNYTRSKRRRAARKFEVYMRKQNREVHFDAEGRYIEPDDLPRGKNDEDDKPRDTRWMN